MSSKTPGLAKPLAWTTISNLATQGIAFLTFAVLARLLGVSTFGLVAMATLFIDILLVICNAGICEAIIQRRVFTEEDADTAFWTHLLYSLFFATALTICAPLIANVFGQPELKSILPALALILIITPLGAIHTARQIKDLQFKSIAFRNLGAALVGALVGLPLAYVGYSIWALVGQRLAAAVTIVLLVWIQQPWRPKLRFSCQSFLEIMRFGGPIGLANTLNQINMRSAEILSSALVGPFAIGFVRAATRITEVLGQISFSPFQQIALPSLAKSAHDQVDFKRTFLNLNRISAMIFYPCFMGVFALAPEVVAVTFGQGWEPVSLAIRILTCGIVAVQINTLIIAATTASGAGGSVLTWTSAQIALSLTAAIAIYPWGWEAILIAGVARAYCVLPYGFSLLKKHVNVQFRDIFNAIKPALISTLLMTVCTYCGATYCNAILSPVWRLSIWIPIGTILYLTIYSLLDRTLYDKIKAIVVSRKILPFIGS